MRCSQRCNPTWSGCGPLTGNLVIATGLATHSGGSSPLRVMAELADLTVAQLLDGYGSGQCSPSDAVAACFDRMDAAEGSLNAVLTEARERAVAEAAESTRRWQGSEARRLEGIPFGAKDVIDTADVRTTGGAVLLEQRVPSADAVAVHRLRDAGAVLVAKLQTFEFAFGANPHFGPAHNPWDVSRTPGGSSEGPGAAVAAGEVPLALGTDTGGSIRIPASLSGITGFKPTFGRVPTTGILPLSESLDHVGPMARTAADCALAFDVISGSDESDPFSHGGAAKTAASLEIDSSSLRVGVATNWFFDRIASDVGEATLTVAAALRDAGATVVEVTVPSVDLAEVVGWTIMATEAARIHAETWKSVELVGPPLATLLAVGHRLGQDDYDGAQRLRRHLGAGVESVFEECDVLLTPGVGFVAPRLDELLAELDDEQVPWLEVVARNTFWHDVVGIPAIAFPAGFAAGLPLGAQLAAPPGRDGLCLAAAHLFQSVSDHHRRRPPAP
jgi:aspartyl-tRNA(Asn)/glutamyl-tRNA(Gln) amidotransferase subunit A